jgi:MAP/microtubule affinity-regulating kinase
VCTSTATIGMIAGKGNLPARFVKQGLLGSGFTGDVWLVLDYHKPELGRVAVKTLSRDLYELHGLSFPPAEVSIAAALYHESVVRVIEVLHEPERIFLVQEHLQGGDLFKCLQEGGVLSEFLARCLVSDILAGVTYIHENGVVHRDIKPENCVFDGNGKVKIIDFGLAARFVPGQLLDDFCGSPEYAAPEVWKEIAYEGPPVDIWAVGVMLYDMVMGHLPFDEESFSFDQFAVDATLSSELRVLLKHILREDPRKRANSCEVAQSDWMSRSSCIGRKSEMELTRESTSFLLSMSLPEESPLRIRFLLERKNALIDDMGLVSSN